MFSVCHITLGGFGRQFFNLTSHQPCKVTSRRFTHLKFFYTWVVPKGLNSKILCSMFVYVLFYVGLCTEPILWVLNNLWFDDLRAEKIGDGLNIVFSRDVILCG